jgi:hypothetical protein
VHPGDIVEDRGTGPSARAGRRLGKCGRRPSRIDPTRTPTSGIPRRSSALPGAPPRLPSPAPARHCSANDDGERDLPDDRPPRPSVRGGRQAAPVPAPFQPHLAGPGRRRGGPDGAERLVFSADAAPLWRQRPQRQSTPHLRPHHDGPAVTVPRHRGTPARICPAQRWPDEDERPDLPK